MLRKTFITPAVALLMCLMFTGAVTAQNLQRDENGGPDYFPPNGQNNGGNIRIDRYLDAEIWPNHLDGDYFVGDNVVLNFRTNRDAFVAIYSIDTKGRVNLLFPTERGQDGFVNGGVTYHLPGGDDDYDLVVAGPEGVENIQIIASRDRFPIPNWYPVSGLICDWDDRFEFMDYLNGRYFVRYGGQKFAFDRSAIYVNEWEPYYYQPVYYPVYPSWSVYGNAYFDYPWGSSIYVDGIYWGCAPLYIPRLYVGWHTITVYDRWGYCWERDVHFTRYHTVILDRNIITTSRTNVSKYKAVRSVGYRDPVTNGYPKFKEKRSLAAKTTGVKTKTGPATGTKSQMKAAPSKRYARGSGKMVSTDRGLESAGGAIDRSKYGNRRSRTSGYSSKTETSSSNDKSTRSTGYNSGSRGRDSQSGRVSSGGKRSSGNTRVNQGSSGSRSNDYYQKRSGSKTRKPNSNTGRVQSKRSGGKNPSKGTKPSVKSRPGPTKSRGGTKSQGVRSGGKSGGAPASGRSSGGGKTSSGGGKSGKGGRK